MPGFPGSDGVPVNRKNYFSTLCLILFQNTGHFISPLTLVKGFLCKKKI